MAALARQLQAPELVARGRFECAELAIGVEREDFPIGVSRMTHREHAAELHRSPEGLPRLLIESNELGGDLVRSDCHEDPPARDQRVGDDGAEIDRPSGG